MTANANKLAAEAVVRRLLRILRYSPQAPRIGRRTPGMRTVARHATGGENKPMIDWRYVPPGLSFRICYEIINTATITSQPQANPKERIHVD